MVAFDSQTINTIYDMPSYDNDEYTAYLGGTVDYNEILRELCHSRARWKLNDDRAPVNFPAQYLKYNPQSWFFFFCSVKNDHIQSHV